MEVNGKTQKEKLALKWQIILCIALTIILLLGFIMIYFAIGSISKSGKNVSTSPFFYALFSLIAAEYTRLKAYLIKITDKSNKTSKSEKLVPLLGIFVALVSFCITLYYCIAVWQKGGLLGAIIIFGSFYLGYYLTLFVSGLLTTILNSKKSTHILIEEKDDQKSQIKNEKNTVIENDLVISENKHIDKNFYVEDNGESGNNTPTISDIEKNKDDFFNENLQCHNSKIHVQTNNGNKEISVKKSIRVNRKNLLCFCVGLIFIVALVFAYVKFPFQPKETNAERYERFRALIYEKKYEEALLIVQDLLKEDYTEAYRGYACMLLEGYGVNKDKSKAVENWEIAASRGDLKSIKSLAKYYEEQEEWDKSLEHFKELENLEDSTCYNDIARFYIDGNNPYLSIEKSLKYANKALKYDDKDAIGTLAWIYLSDKCLDYDLAYYWLKKGTEECYDDYKVYCWGNLGWMFLTGSGCNINYEKAYECFSYALSISDTDDYALFNIGSMYYYGQYVNKDKSIAQVYIRKAADLGNEEAQKLLARINRDN